MVIKDLLNSIKETILLLKELERSAAHNSSEIEFLRHKLTALKEIQRYVTGGDWTRDASREKFVALAKSDFEYELIASRYHTTRASLDVFVSRQNERLERVIGEALTLIAENRIEERSFIYDVRKIASDIKAKLPDTAAGAYR